MKMKLIDVINNFKDYQVYDTQTKMYAIWGISYTLDEPCIFVERRFGNRVSSTYTIKDIKDFERYGFRLELMLDE